MTAVTPTAPSPAALFPAALAFTALDLRALRPYVRSVLLSLVIAGVAIVLPSRSAYGVLPAMIFIAAVVGPQYPFSLDERAHLDTLYATLPITRRAVVLGRYATMATVALGLGTLGLVLTLALAPAFGEDLDPQALAMVATGAAGAFGILTAVQLPFFYALGYTRARPFAFIAPMAAAAVAIVVVSRDESLLANVASNLASWPFLAALAAAGAAAFAGSAVLSVRLYARRDL